MIQVGDDLPDLELKVIKKGEIKDMRLIKEIISGN